jgi:ABC-type antimicrobial peptide transport system permease subunit
MLGLFASIAILLAMIGLYAVKAYTVARRTREIGIRMAVGADSADVLRMVLREGLGVTAIGVAGGVILALASGKLLAGMLYEVQAVDLTVLSLATLLLTAMSMLACYLPARKAARIDPIVALRFD